MEDNYIFEILDDRTFIYTISDNEVKIGTGLRLDNQDDLINIELTEDNKIKEMLFTFINRNINIEKINVDKNSIEKKESLQDFQTVNSSNYLLNFSNNNLNIVFSTGDNSIKSFYEDGTMTYYFNGNNELVMLGKSLGKEEKEYFEYILSPIPTNDPKEVLNEISEREGIKILEASFIGDESWEKKIVNSYYHLRFIYDDKDKSNELSYPYELNADIKGIGVRELFKRLGEDDIEAYETLFSGLKLLTSDYVLKIRSFTRNNINYNNILRKYLEIQNNFLETVKEGDIIPTSFLLGFVRRAQLMRIIQLRHNYTSLTYDYAFGSHLPYLAELKPYLDELIEYKKNNPLIEIDKDQIDFMKEISDYTIPDNDDYNYDVEAKDELLSKADDLAILREENGV